MIPTLIRAILRSYDSSSHTAVVEPENGPAAALAGLAVLSSCRAEELLPGRLTTALLWPDGGGVLLGAQALPRASRLLVASGYAQPNADVTLTEAFQDCLSLTLPDVPPGAELALWADADCECTAWSANQYASAQLVVDGTAHSELVERVTAQWLIIHLPLVWTGALAAGSRVITLQARKWSALNTVLAKTRSHLVWQLYA